MLSHLDSSAAGSKRASAPRGAAESSLDRQTREAQPAAPHLEQPVGGSGAGDVGAGGVTDDLHWVPSWAAGEQRHTHAIAPLCLVAAAKQLRPLQPRACQPHTAPRRITRPSPAAP